MNMYLITFDLRNPDADAYRRAYAATARLGFADRSPRGSNGTTCRLPTTTVMGQSAYSVVEVRLMVERAFAEAGLEVDSIIVVLANVWAGKAA